MSSSFLILGLTSFLDPVLTMLLGLGGGSGKSENSCAGDEAIGGGGGDGSITCAFFEA